MALDVGGKYFSFRAGGTTYQYYSLTTTEGGTKYLAFRRGGVTRYLPFSTSGTGRLRLRSGGTTYSLIIPSSVFSFTYISFGVRNAGSRFNPKYRVEFNPKSGTPTLSRALSHTLSITFKFVTSQGTFTHSGNIPAGATTGTVYSYQSNNYKSMSLSSATMTITYNGVSQSVALQAVSVIQDPITKTLTIS